MIANCLYGMYIKMSNSNRNVIVFIILLHIESNKDHQSAQASLLFHF